MTDTSNAVPAFAIGQRVRNRDVTSGVLATVEDVVESKDGIPQVWIRYDDDPPHDPGYPHKADDGRLEIVHE
jgi:hypothetical protein